MDISSLTTYACFGDGDMCSVKHCDDNIQRYVKLEDVIELLKHTTNKQSTPLIISEYCAVHGYNKLRDDGYCDLCKR